MQSVVITKTLLLIHRMCFDLGCEVVINIILNPDQVSHPHINLFLGHYPQINVWGGSCVSVTPLSCRVAVCWDGEWSGQRKNLVLQSTLPAHHPPSSSHPVAICSDAGQRTRRRIGVDQTTPQREGEQGGAWQGVACHSTSSTGQYRTAWAPPSPPPAHTLHAEGSPPPNSNPAVTDLVDKMTY